MKWEDEEEETHLAVKERRRPMSHIRRVSTGMSGSSMFETEARTSGYGLSSSWRVSKSNFILRKSQCGTRIGRTCGRTL